MPLLGPPLGNVCWGRRLGAALLLDQADINWRRHPPIHPGRGDGGRLTFRGACLRPSCRRWVPARAAPIHRCLESAIVRARAEPGSRRVLTRIKINGRG